jgi:hypothetical protein
MDRMNFKDNDSKLDALLAQYRDAIPDQDAGANFMPELWKKIESRRHEGVFALGSLFAEYRQAVPDPEPSSSFMPSLWRKIDARRMESVWVFRRLAKVCVLATAALTLAMVAITHLQSKPVFSASYVDMLDAATTHSLDSAQLLDSGVYQ